MKKVMGYLPWVFIYCLFMVDYFVLKNKQDSSFWIALVVFLIWFEIVRFRVKSAE